MIVENCEVLTEKYQQVLVKIIHNNFTYKGILKAKDISTHLNYKIGERITCVVVAYKEDYLVVKPVQE